MERLDRHWNVLAGESHRTPDAELEGISAYRMIEELHRRGQLIAEREDELRKLEDRLIFMSADASDIIEINAGGQIFAVRRDTLCLAPGSVLAALFSGHWDAGQQRDTYGRPFLDVDPYIFDKVVNFLRQKRIEGPESPAPKPCVSAEKALEFERIVEYYGLTAFMGLERPRDFIVQSLSLGRDTEKSSHTDGTPRGYAFRLTEPLRLHAVLVGVNQEVVVAVGTGADHVQKQVLSGSIKDSPSHQLWQAGESSLVQIAEGFDMTLEPGDVFIMVMPTQQVMWSYVPGDNNFRRAGPFFIESKTGIPLSRNTYSIDMAVVYS
eukprot:TRINITY_DN31419_c0_g1_i2.p1 TRINITY_DN31419_c0_g1~~TRINITY_DN31419_c0_g1_i2.p1  ORF type:complete len:334 (-),score=43.69 TRINITY_DN31419_c0_g1_i2:261-1226(-)